MLLTIDVIFKYFGWWLQWFKMLLFELFVLISIFNCKYDPSKQKKNMHVDSLDCIEYNIWMHISCWTFWNLTVMASMDGMQVQSTSISDSHWHVCTPKLTAVTYILSIFQLRAWKSDRTSGGLARSLYMETMRRSKRLPISKDSSSSIYLAWSWKRLRLINHKRGQILTTPFKA